MRFNFDCESSPCGEHLFLCSDVFLDPGFQLLRAAKSTLTRYDFALFKNDLGIDPTVTFNTKADSMIIKYIIPVITHCVVQLVEKLFSKWFDNSKSVQIYNIFE